MAVKQQVLARVDTVEHRREYGCAAKIDRRGALAPMVTGDTPAPGTTTPPVASDSA